MFTPGTVVRHVTSNQLILVLDAYASHNRAFAGVTLGTISVFATSWIKEGYIDSGKRLEFNKDFKEDCWVPIKKGSIVKDETQTYYLLLEDPGALTKAVRLCAKINPKVVYDIVFIDCDKVRSTGRTFNVWVARTR